MYKDTYAKFLPHINNNYDFQELLSEILGELNASTPEDATVLRLLIWMLPHVWFL
jgi:predicted Zn-dependent peptidase